MGSSLFISYSHLDLAWMQVFQKHLQGSLMDRCRVWTDEDIPAGSTWEHVLQSQLKQAGAGLVLASPDYLVSPWCRHELKVLFNAYKDGRLSSVHWVQLRPCGPAAGTGANWRNCRRCTSRPPRHWKTRPKARNAERW